MNILGRFCRFVSVVTTGVMLLGISSACAVTFTQDTLIGVGVTNYDQTDIVVTNCTLTVDGVHAFASLQVLRGGVLTHSFATNGALNQFAVTNEPHVLTGTNTVPLNYFGNASILLGLVSVRDASGRTNYTNGLDFYSIGPNYSVTIQRINDGAIPDGATVLASYTVGFSSTPSGVNLSVTGDVSVAVGGIINVNGRGYANGQGPGAGKSQLSVSYTSGGGGGHGGYGGLSASNAPGGLAYDSITQPTDKGSSGGTSYDGPGGAGGGAVRLNIGGALHLDGVISARGANAVSSRSGGGAGGSVWITARTVDGAGAIVVDGGAGEPSIGGGGGGGQVALYYNTNLFSGTLQARGGPGGMAGGAGTVYTRKQSQTVGQVTMDNGGQMGTNTWLQASEPFDVIVGGGTIASMTKNQTIATLLVQSNGWISAGVNSSVNLYIAANAVIQPGSGIIADGAGNQGASGPGPGQYSSANYSYWAGGGGGHGGNGGIGGGFALGGTANDSVLQPTNSGGSGGGYLASGVSQGGPGGAAIRLTVNGSLIVNGRISANGVAGAGLDSGGGAGGSIWLNVNGYSGSGSITANGGNGQGPGGGGGGGRIAIYSAQTNNNFAGTIQAFGGTGYIAGGAGTIYTSNSVQTVQLLLDNGGRSGTNTPLTSTLGTLDFTMRGGALTPPFSGTFGNLFIGSNSWLTTSTSGNTANLSVVVTKNATIQAGGGISLDGGGNLGGAGTSAGQSLYVNGVYSGSGAGHGGDGGASSLGVMGGSSFDSMTQPTSYGGGGGGSGGGLPQSGGVGGGSVKLAVGGTLTLDGRISVNALDAASTNSGGGAGGSIWLTAGTLTGAGVISAKGSAGSLLGGGGGGGRIAIYLQTNTFLGSVSASGGAGGHAGGAGTIYTQITNQTPTLILDNSGRPGAASGLTSSTYTYSLALSNGAVIYVPNNSSLYLSSLLIGSNSWLIFSNNYSSYTLNVNSNATIQAGGGIIADGIGPTYSSSGQGGYSYYNSGVYTGGGGGHGGNGAPSILGIGGGSSASDTYTSPTLPGGAGGGNPATPGGGVITMNVTGTLLVNGRISANGNDATGQNFGGGAGGSIAVTAGLFAGNGMISANGGMGYGLGGGGGGGRIAFTPKTNLFAGTITAYGNGSGTNYGGAGSIFLNYGGYLTNSVLIFDNGGHSGAYSSTYSGSYYNYLNLVVAGGAALFNSTSLYWSSLLIRSNSWIVFSNYYASSSITMTLNGNGLIEAGGGIIADGTGISGGGGGTRSYVGSGGGGAHAGFGGNSGSGGRGDDATANGGFYDYPQSPTYSGNGGAGSYTYASATNVGGAGGGSVSMSLSGTLTVNGRITADGNPGVGLGSGGGAGGSVYLSGNGTLAGTGIISAHGGAGMPGFGGGGGGGGGRIALVIKTNLFGGLVNARGGAGANYGGAGTICTAAGSGGQTGKLLVDNGGTVGAYTYLGQGSSSTPFDLTVTGGGMAIAWGTTFSVNNLLVTSNSWLAFINTNASPTPTSVSKDATFQAGGGIWAMGTGFWAGQGPGAGIYTNNAGSGGSHAGLGAPGSGVISKTTAYDSMTLPAMAGSGGGIFGSATCYNCAPTNGGAGGGTVVFNVPGTLDLEGGMLADGGDGITPSVGGGAGGSIQLNVGTLAGAGRISANGGDGKGPGGGGGGGRIALLCNTNLFTGAVSAAGGGGYGRGGAGTIYTKINSASVGQVMVDNNNWPSTNATFLTTGSFDLTIQNGAAVNPGSSPTFRNLVVASNSTMTFESFSVPSTINVSGDAIIQAGGRISANGNGSSAGQGTGPGGNGSNTLSVPYIAGGGGAFGGYGSGGIGGAAGGAAYGSVIQPSQFGSGGAPANFGGAGGGGIRLVVNGTLNLAGSISADGLAGNGDTGGGGSGGSVWITAGALLGSGSISANGGSGAGYGGGGGGGRIALNYAISQFKGTMSAFGGSGYAGAGGAGTIYAKANNESIGSTYADNGGQFGTNTSVASGYLGMFDLTVANGAVVSPPSSLLLLNNVLINNGGTLTGPPLLTNLDLEVLGNVDIEPGGALTVDGMGQPINSGLGAGSHDTFFGGSGAGYGGVGGSSGAALGGMTYGSTNQPVDLGSGGGTGSGGLMVPGGSQGGGAIRLNVGGFLIVNGQLSANGIDGLMDDAGGGSGGSILVTAGGLAGTGIITANGGDGELYEGGGGGGGRIAIYAGANSFSGTISAAGGLGLIPGGKGSIVTSANVPSAPAVLSQTPSGPVFNPVSFVDLVFNEAVNPNYLVSSNFIISNPFGNPVLTTVTQLSSSAYRISFATQALGGTFSVKVGPKIPDLAGRFMTQSYSNYFTVMPPIIQGIVTDTNGLPVPGVQLLVSGGISGVTTDTNGQFTFTAPFNWSGSMTPTNTGNMFVPGRLSFVNVSQSLSNRNFLMVNTIAPALIARTQVAPGQFTIQLQGIKGVVYSLYYSTDLVNWQLYDTGILGTGGTMQISLPMFNVSGIFYRLQAGN